MKVNAPLLNGYGDRNRHSLTHQVSTTSDFGFVQPILLNEVEPKSTNKFRIGQVVQASPMVKPVFGDIRVKTYNSFVPISDIWHAYESFLTGESYNGVGGSYIPGAVPTFKLCHLTALVHEYGQYVFFESRNGSTPQDITPHNYRFSISNFHVIPDSTEANSPYREAFNAYAGHLNSKFGILPAQTSAAYAHHGSESSPTCKYNDQLTPYSCDWFVFVNNGNGTNVKSFVVGGRYSQFAKNLIKICSGIGLPLSMSEGFRSILPLVAYYKVYFDLFTPKRLITWKNTNAYHMMELIEQNGITQILPTSDEVYTSFRNFVKNDLVKCYYTDNVDYVSSHIIGPVNEISGTESLDYVDMDGDSQTLTNGEPGQQMGLIGGTIGQTALNVLKATWRRLNIRSALGGDIGSQLRSIFGSDYRDDKQSNYIGSQSISLNLDKVVSTAQTEQGYLAEFAGKGEGRDAGQTFTFNATVPGYIISLMCVVPNSNYSQGTDKSFTRILKEDFWSKDYDSITLECSRKSDIYGQVDLCINKIDSNLELGFGNKPLYLEYKTKLNRLSGEFCMMSVRSNVLPYTLDKLLPLTDVAYIPDLNYCVFRNLDQDVLVAGEQWRYIGLYPWLGNQRRIFLNEDGNDFPTTGQHRGNVESYVYDRDDDNFIVHCYFEYDKFSGALAVADSWQTEAYGEHLSQELA